MDEKTLRHWIEVIQTYGKGLTAWEEEFIQSVDAALYRDGGLSPKREEILERIYTEKTP